MSRVLAKEGIIKEGSLTERKNGNSGSKSSRAVPLHMMQNNLAPRGQTAGNNTRNRGGRSMGVAIVKD